MNAASPNRLGGVKCEKRALYTKMSREADLGKGCRTGSPSQNGGAGGQFPFSVTKLSRGLAGHRTRLPIIGPVSMD